ncbi:LOW QUALITY PROTEIN: helicase SRCAP [Guaruba guarouba]
MHPQVPAGRMTGSSPVSPASSGSPGSVSPLPPPRLDPPGPMAPGPPEPPSLWDKTHAEIAEQAKHEAEVEHRVAEMKREGFWSLRRLPKVPEPPRPKVHWDYLCEEMQWLAADFAQERRWKRGVARKVVRMVMRHHEEQRQKEERAKREEQAKLRRVAAAIAKEVKQFWSNVEKVVQFKQHSRLEEKRKQALDLQLDFIVGQTEKYSDLLSRSLNAPHRVQHPAGHGDLELPDEDPPDGSPPETRPRDLQEVLGALPPQALLQRNKSPWEPREEDEEFAAEEEEGEDEEETIAAQERLEGDVDHKQELDDLAREGALPMEELLQRYAGAFADSDCESPPGASSTRSDSPAAESDEEEEEDDDDEDEEDEDDDEDEDEEEEEDDEGAPTPPPSAPAPPPPSAPTPKKEITDIAAAAESLQPKGYTLATTQVKTPIPHLLRGTLREYQHIGLDWLVTMYEKKLNGILADEMGLGKTIQTISLLAHLACEKGSWGPHLIIVPTSVMLNWEMELKRWCPSFKILTYYGAQKERRLKRQGWTKPNAFHVCITSYKLVLQDHQAFRRKNWKYLILDEAQNIKNFKSQRWQSLLNFNSQRRLLLTGTPLQNSLMELWSLMHFLMPRVFQSHREFKEWFSNPLTGMIEGSQEYNESLVKRLHKVLRPFLLRRLKVDVEKQMPQKFEHVLRCRLSQRQRFLYDDFMAQASTKATLASGHFLSVINVLMQLRKVCNHPDLFEPRPVHSPFVTPGLCFRTAAMVLRALEHDPFKHVDMALFDLLALEGRVSRYAARTFLPLRVTRRHLEDVAAAPDPPPRPKPVRMKVNRMLQPVPKAESRAVLLLNTPRPAGGAPAPLGVLPLSPAPPPQPKPRPCWLLPKPRPLPPKPRPSRGPAPRGRPLHQSAAAPRRGGGARPRAGIGSGGPASPCPHAAARLGPAPRRPRPCSADPSFGRPPPPAGTPQPPPAPPNLGGKGGPPLAAYALPGPGPQRLLLAPDMQARLPSGELVSIGQLAALAQRPGGVTPGGGGGGAKPLTLQLQGSKLTLAAPPLRHLALAPPPRPPTERGSPGGRWGAAPAPGPPRPGHPPGACRTPPASPGGAPRRDHPQAPPTIGLPIATAQVPAPLVNSGGVVKIVVRPAPPRDGLSAPPATPPRPPLNPPPAPAPGAARRDRAPPHPPPATAPPTEAAPAPPRSPFYLESLEAKRSRGRSERLERLLRLNELRCGLGPIYGTEVLGACTPPPTPPPGGALARAQLSPPQRLQQLQPLLDRFIFVLPPVQARTLSLHSGRPPPWRLRQWALLEQRLSQELALSGAPPPPHPYGGDPPSHRDPHAGDLDPPEHRDTLHRLLRPWGTHFPDRRLVQYDCGKLQTLDLLLRRLKAGAHRVLIFTQMTRMLDVLERFLTYHGHIYLRLDGSTRVEQRQALMERFNADKRIFCFILSTRSGGVGVNLAGDTVVFYDSDWNPTMDAQAQDRCHRIGQTRDVHIYRLISERTVEENILKKANQKRMLGDMAIEGGNFTTAYFKQVPGIQWHPTASHGIQEHPNGPASQWVHGALEHPGIQVVPNHPGASQWGCIPMGPWCPGASWYPGGTQGSSSIPMGSWCPGASWYPGGTQPSRSIPMGLHPNGSMVPWSILVPRWYPRLQEHPNGAASQWGPGALEHPGTQVVPKAPGASQWGCIPMGSWSILVPKWYPRLQEHPNGILVPRWYPRLQEHPNGILVPRWYPRLQEHPNGILVPRWYPRLQEHPNGILVPKWYPRLQEHPNGILVPRWYPRLQEHPNGILVPRWVYGEPMESLWRAYREPIESLWRVYREPWGSATDDSTLHLVTRSWAQVGV